MSKISTYPSAETPLLLSDRLIGTEAIRTPPTSTPLATKNFSLGELLQLFSANFPAASLQAVLNTGNTATQNITLVGTITSTLIKPTNIEDTSGSQGTTFQFLSKGTSSINWVNLPVDNLQSVLNAGNTATQNITLVGNITSTRIIPGNIQDDTAGIGTTGQILSKTASGIRWINSPTATTPGLADVLSVGNTATNNITLIGDINATNAKITGAIYDSNNSPGTSGQILSSTVTGTDWIDSPISTPAALTKVNDTNVTLTLGGNPNTALLQAVSLTLGWTGTLADSRIASASIWNAKQDALNGTGFVKVTGTTVSYDNSTYYLASNPSGFITSAALAGYVPYSGATGDLSLGTNNIFAKQYNFYDPAYSLYGSIDLDAEEFTFKTTPTDVVARITYGSTFLTGIGFSAQLVYTGLTANRVYTLPNASGTIALTSDIPTPISLTTTGSSGSSTLIGGVLNVPTYTLSGLGGVPTSRTITINGVTQDLSVDRTWTIASSGGIPHATASGTDTYTATVSGVTSYADGDAYLIRFTNGNTTGATLNINALGAIPLYRNNDGALIGGDIWDGAEMLCVYNSTANIFQCIGTSPNSLFAYITNAEATTIIKGQVVYAFGGTGDRMTVKLANNSGDSTSAQTVGVVVTSSIATNQKGIIIIQGLLSGLNILPTSTWADGDPIYLGSTPGSITKVKPYAPNHLVYLGVVTTASNGSAGRWYVRVQNGYELDELHNVQAQSPAVNDILYYFGGSPGQWKTASIPTVLGYTPFQLPSLTSGSVLFSNGTTIAQDNANFFWDNTNNRLGIGTNTGVFRPLTVQGTDSEQILLRNDLGGPEGISSYLGGNLASFDISTGGTFTYGPLTMFPSTGLISFTGLEVFYGNITSNFLPKKDIIGFSNSLIYDDGTNVGIGTIIPATKLDVNGVITATGGNSTSWNAKQDAITLTTTGTSGPATLVGTTLNIPEYAGGGSTPIDIQLFTSSGVWTKPAGATIVEIYLVGAGAGGGSGRRGATLTARHGGGGGSSGTLNAVKIQASVLGATENVWIGAGGVGGSAITVNDTNGSNGATGAASFFGGSGTLATSLISTNSSIGGNGGTATSQGGGSFNPSYYFSGVLPANTFSTPNNGPNSLAPSTASLPMRALVYGGMGGGLSTTNVSSGGQAVNITAPNTSKILYSVAAGANGVLYTAASLNNLFMSTGGGGGNAGTDSGSTAAVAGGNGGNGSGGGGGGASANGFNSGAGGRGGDGLCMVITYF